MNRLSTAPWGATLIAALGHPKSFNLAFKEFWERCVRCSGDSDSMAKMLELLNRKQGTDGTGHYRDGVLRESIQFVATMKAPWRTKWTMTMGHAMMVVVAQGTFRFIGNQTLEPGDVALVSMTEGEPVRDVISRNSKDKGPSLVLIAGVNRPGLSTLRQVTLSTGDAILVRGQGGGVEEVDLSRSRRVVPHDVVPPLDTPQDIKLSASMIAR